MAQDTTSSIAYLIRLWRAQSGQGTVWRAFLTDVDSGTPQGFRRLGELFAHLQAQMLDLQAARAELPAANRAAGAAGRVSSCSERQMRRSVEDEEDAHDGAERTQGSET